MNPIYLDNNATTPLLPAAWEAMRPYFHERFGNPASSHRVGQRARKALEDARDEIAALAGALPEEVHFTSGATEANNLAIFGLARSPGTLVTSLIEHPCVLEPLRQLERDGFRLTHLPVDADGSITLDAAFPEDVRLVAVMLANHETGALQPVEQLARKLEGRAPFHCDAAAAAGKIRVSFRALGVTSLTLSAHKFHGPPGIGALLLQRGVRLRPLFHGGHQQHGTRPGTEAVALAVGMATALKWSLDHLDAHRARLLALRTRLLDRLQLAAPVLLNGPESGGLPGTLNLAFPGCHADALLMKLDLAGVACSTGSACSSGSLLPSPVLAAMGKTGPALLAALRFSLSPLLTDADIDEAAKRIVRCVAQLRAADE